MPSSIAGRNSTAARAAPAWRPRSSRCARRAAPTAFPADTTVVPAALRAPATGREIGLPACGSTWPRRTPRHRTPPCRPAHTHW